MTRRALLAAAALLAGGTAAVALPPWPNRPPVPFPPPVPQTIEGVWYFRGDPFAPCQIQAVPTRRGVRLMFVNEKGTPAEGRLLWDRRTVVVRDWNVRGDYRGNAIVWQNGDFWAR